MAHLAWRATDPGFINKFKSQELSNLAWAYASLGIRDMALMAAIADRTLQDGFLSTCSAQTGTHNRRATRRGQVGMGRVQAPPYAIACHI